jgi:hypothetical protein
MPYVLSIDADPASLLRADDSALVDGGAAAALGAPLAVRASPRGGRGLFALRDVAAGERLLTERAFLAERAGAAEAWTPPDLLPDDVDAALLQLAPRGASAAAPGAPAPRAALLAAALAANAFGVGAAAPGSAAGAAAQGGAGRALFLVLSMANHACDANARVVQLDGGGGDDEDDGAPPARALEARRAIAAGEEVFIAYVPVTWARPARAARLAAWGFACGCARCAAERGDDTVARRCAACAGGRVFGGARACADCGAPAPAAAAGAGAGAEAAELAALTAPGRPRELVERLLRHPTLAPEDVRVFLACVDIIPALARAPALQAEVRSAARAAAVRMQYVAVDEFAELADDAPAPGAAS